MQASTIIFILGTVGLAKSTAIAGNSLHNWDVFKETHGKIYENTVEEMYRKSIFKKNIAKINEHNKLFLSGLETYSMGVNKFTDMLLKEVVGKGFQPRERSSRNLYIPRESANIPTEIDYRTVKGVVTPVKDQFDCGDCWAFSTTGAIEGQMMLRRNISVSLSEQQLNDCNGIGMNCSMGGDMIDAYKYVQKAGGIMSEDVYPYGAYDYPCKFDKTKVVAKVVGYAQTEKGNEDALTHAIATVGPVSVAMCVTENLQYYGGGIFSDDWCFDICDMNHALLAVGYGTEDGQDYYIIKNSWGGGFGENGYFRLARNKNNMCKISNDVSFPKV